MRRARLGLELSGTSRVFSRLLPLAVLAGVCFGQSIHVGLKVGLPFTTYYETGKEVRLGGSTEYSAATRRYTAGASLEWRFTRPLGFEMDAIYKRTGYVRIATVIGGSTFTTSSFDVKGNSWDFPLMLKYRPGRTRRPYFAAGLSLRYIGPVRAKGETVLQDFGAGLVTRTSIDTSDPPDLQRRLRPGAVAAAGIEFGPGRLRFLPEFRYTRWSSDITGGSLLRLNPNQSEFLLGLLF